MIRRLPDRSLLDLGALPVADLARIAIREGVRPRPVYQAHKWFARRLAVTARSLLIAAAAREGASFWRVFYQPESWGERTVLDPFVGGGVMLLEASRLGANVHGVDIEPVAAAIANFQSTLRELPGLDEPLHELAATVGQVLAPYYQVEDDEGRCETLLHAFWVQSVECAACRTRFDAHPAFRFSWDDAQSRQWVACRACSRVLVTDLAAKTVACTCGAETDILSGHTKSGEACCPKCGAKEKLINYARRTQATPVFRMFAVETLRDDFETLRAGVPTYQNSHGFRPAPLSRRRTASPAASGEQPLCAAKGADTAGGALR